MIADAVRIEVGARNLALVHLGNLSIEENAGTGRVYFVDRKDRIVAVAKRRALSQDDGAKT